MDVLPGLDPLIKLSNLRAFSNHICQSLWLVLFSPETTIETMICTFPITVVLLMLFALLLTLETIVLLLLLGGWFLMGRVDLLIEGTVVDKDMRHGALVGRSIADGLSSFPSLVVDVMFQTEGGLVDEELLEIMGSYDGYLPLSGLLALPCFLDGAGHLAFEVVHGKIPLHKEVGLTSE